MLKNYKPDKKFCGKSPTNMQFELYQTRQKLLLSNNCFNLITNFEYNQTNE